MAGGVDSRLEANFYKRWKKITGSTRRMKKRLSTLKSPI